MKNWISYFFCISALLVPSLIKGMPVCNPANPGLFNEGIVLGDTCLGVRVGYRSDHVYNKPTRDLVTDSVEEFSLTSNVGLLTLNLWKRIDIYGYVGSATLGFNTVEFDSEDALTVSTQSTCIYGYGIKAILWEYCFGKWGTSYIAVDGQYERIKNSVWNRALVNGAYSDGSPFSSQFDEWQIALGIAHKIHFFVPYIAVKCSTSKSPFVYFNPDTMKNQGSFGYVFGTTLIIASKMSITAEARFFNETAFTLASEIKF